VTELLGEGVVQLVLGLDPDLVDSAAKLGLFAGQVFCVILLREGYLDGYLFAADLVQQLLFKPGINAPLPKTKVCFSAVPPANCSPSQKPA